MSAPAAASTVQPAEVVRGAIGDGALLDDPGAWATRDRAPAAVAAPGSVDEAAELFREASAAGLRVLPAGRGLWLGGGPPPGPVDLVVTTRRMDRIVQYEPADLTLTAQAGVGLDDLEEATGEHGQWLPADPPGVPGGTLGAMVSTASAGHLATRYGAVRDLVLGITVVTGDGRVLRVGGRVVKNVAGFDLVRLMVGSWGTLGLLAEVTVRLYPRPATVRCLRARASTLEELVPAALAVAGGPVVPARLELREVPDEEKGRHAALLVALHGTEAATSAEAEALRRRAPELELLDREPPPPEPARDPDLVVRMRGPRSGLGELVDVARAMGRLEGGRNELRGAPVVLRADPLRGSVRVVVPNVRADERWAELWSVRLEDLRRTLTVRGGGLTVESAPGSILRGVSAGAPVEGTRASIMGRMRDHFDPERILAPERFDF